MNNLRFYIFVIIIIKAHYTSPVSSSFGTYIYIYIAHKASIRGGGGGGGGGGRVLPLRCPCNFVVLGVVKNDAACCTFCALDIDDNNNKQ